MRRYLVTLLFSFLILFLCANSGAELRFEIDKNLSIESGVINTKSLYESTILFQDKCISNPRLKLIGSFILSSGTLMFGHEYFGHGSILRAENIDHNYDLLNTTANLNCSNPYLRSSIILGGFKYENELKREIIEDEFLFDVSYEQAILISTINLTRLLRVKSRGKGDDFSVLSKSWKKINQNTKLSENYINNLVIESVFFDPISISNYLFVLSFYSHNFNYVYHRFNYPIPSFNINLYPGGITREFGMLLKSNEEELLSLSYENGMNIFNKNIQGYRFEIKNIYIPKYKLSTDFEVHCVSDTTFYVLSSIYFDSFYFRWKHNMMLFDEFNDRNQISIGIKIDLNPSRPRRKTYISL